MLITISGPLGSGCSTTAKNIAINMSMDYFTAGKVMKAIAKERKLSEDELRTAMLTDPTTDYEIDKTQKIKSEEDKVVIDSKLGAWKVDRVDLKVYLHAPMRIRANRYSKKHKMPVTDAIKDIEEREKKDTQRFLKWYGVNIEDVSIYDLIINTEKWDSDGVLFIISKAIQRMSKVKMTI